MTWLTNLNPAVAAAVVSAVVSLVVALITALLAPSVKYGFDRRLERRKLELAYVAEQSKALRDRIGFHKGTILSAAEGLASRMQNYQETPDAHRFSGARLLYTYIRLSCFDLLARDKRLFAGSDLYDAAVAKKSDWAFVKAVELNLDIWSEVRLFNGLGYSGSTASDRDFSADISLALLSTFTKSGNSRAITSPEFEQLLNDGMGNFDRVFRYLNQLLPASSMAA